MRVVFLDVDGVLNSVRDLMEYRKKNGIDHCILYDEVEDRPLGLLKTIVDSTGCKLVVSSTWRKAYDEEGNAVLKAGKLYKKLEKRLLEYGMEVFDVTPVVRGDDVERGDEIRAWLAEHLDVESFVILDDDSDMREFTSTHLVKTTYENGLTEEHVKKAIAMLLST